MSAEPIPLKRSSERWGQLRKPIRPIPSQVIQALNRLRATEVTSYLQYKQHAYMAVSLFAPGLKATLKRTPPWNSSTRICWPSAFSNWGVPLYSPVDIAAQAAAMGVRPEQGRRCAR